MSRLRPAVLALFAVSIALLACLPSVALAADATPGGGGVKRAILAFLPDRDRGEEQPQPGDHGFDHWFSTQNNCLPSHHNPYNFVRNGIPVGPLEGYASQLVADEAITQTQRLLWDRLRIAAEPGGSAALAALISGRYQPRANERVGVLLCGANVDASKLGT